MNQLKGLRLLSPKLLLSGTLSKPKFINLPENEKKTPETEIEFNQIHLIDWTEVIPADCLEDTAKFYAAIRDYRDGKFKNFAEYAIHSLLIPHSNADIERLFSIAGAVKVKSRNKILIGTLDAIVRIRSIRVGNKCIHNSLQFDKMLDFFNSSIYNSNGIE